MNKRQPLGVIRINEVKPFNSIRQSERELTEREGKNEKERIWEKGKKNNKDENLE